MKKNYKIGDRIFYECFDGTIDSDIIVDIQEDSYFNDRNREVKFNSLITWKSESGNCSTAIEDYNTLPESDPRVKEYITKIKEKLNGKINDLYLSVGAKTKKEQEYVKKTLMWMAKNASEDFIEFSDLI